MTAVCCLYDKSRAILEEMKIVVLYRPKSEHGRTVETYIRDFSHQHESEAKLLETLDVDTRDGVALASLYDIMQSPAVLVLADDGQLIKFWQGVDLPLMDELAGYVYNA
jgi:hypothetical protein